jgi:protein O-mannosyl-transferase
MGRRRKKNRPLDRVSPDPKSRTQNPYVVLAVCGLLLLAVGLVFGQTVRHEFVSCDDQEYVCANPHVTDGLTVPGVVWAFTTGHASNWHPLTWLSHMLDCQLYGLHAGGHHLTNVLLHAVNAVLLFLVFWRMTGDLWPSAFVAALFAIHPLHVESVAWVAERKDLLSGLFFLLTLAAYVGYVRHPFSLARYTAVVVFFALGLMAKPMLVTLPFVLLLLDYWPLGRWPGSCAATPGSTVQPPPQRRYWFPWRLLVEKIPLLLLTAASCVVTPLVQNVAVILLDALPVSWRIANALVAYIAYVGQLFYPVGLAAYYPHPGRDLPIWEVVGALVLLTGISAGALAWRRSFPYLFVGWLWYLGMLVPVIGLVQVGTQAMADRYTYLTQIGLYVAMAWGTAQLCRSWPYRGRLCGIAAALVLAGLMGCAWQQTRYWHDSETLWTHALACTSRNLVAEANLGLALADRGQIDEAIAHYRKALEIQPVYVDAHNNLGAALAGRGQIDEAIVHFQKAIEINPDYVDAHNNLGAALADRGQIDEAMAHYQKALDIKPGNAKAHYNLSLSLADRGKIDEAIAHCQKALEITPDYADARNNFGVLLAGRGQLDEAIAQFQKAIEIKPDDADSRQNLHLALARRKSILQGLAKQRELIRSRPSDTNLLNDTAWILATNPNGSVRDGAEAVALAQRAEKLSGGREPAIFDTLAAAYAEAGRFSEAVNTAERAASLASARGDTAMADAIRHRIQLYQSGAPYHETRSQHPK